MFTVLTPKYSISQTCQSPDSLVFGTYFSSNTSSGDNWITINSPYSIIRLSLSSDSLSIGAIDSVILFSGTCNSLNIEYSKGLLYSVENFNIMEVSGITPNINYLMKIVPSSVTANIPFTIQVYGAPGVGQCNPDPCQFVCNPSFKDDVFNGNQLPWGEIELSDWWDNPALGMNGATPDYMMSPMEDTVPPTCTGNGNICAP